MNLKAVIKNLSENMGNNIFANITRGIEKENLRLHFSGKLSQTDHPISLGKTLTNPYLTTDFSEALPELITPPLVGIQTVQEYLLTIHRFVVDHLSDEYLWPFSMPPQIDNELEVRIAEYGQSDAAQMKKIYRTGLWHRYGRIMQSIAGIHYNFSLPDEFFRALKAVSNNKNDDFYTFRSQAYMKLIRTFHCHAWLLPYLFGASPLCFNSSVISDRDYLQTFDNESQYAQWGTSLRMSDLGYQNTAQDNLKISYDSVKDYALSLIKATSLPSAEYEKIGIKVDEKYKQLNAHVLQIENEYYSFIRPKPKMISGERPAVSLCRRGVDYIEVRLLDLNPLVPMGIDAQTMAFMDLFLLYCLLADCDDVSHQNCTTARKNFQQIATQGRKPNLQLKTDSGGECFVGLTTKILESMSELAVWMDKSMSEPIYQQTLKLQVDKVNDAALTPSAMMIEKIRSQEITYRDFCFLQAEKETNYIMHAQYDMNVYKILEDSVQQSIEEWQEKENQERDFTAFLQQYFANE